MDSNNSSRMAQVPFFYSLSYTFISRSKFSWFTISRKPWEIKQTLLLSLHRKSGICHRMAPLRMLYVMILTYIFIVTNFEMWLSRKQWRLTKMLKYDVIAIDICHRMWSLRMLYSVTLAYIFKIKLFKWLLWQVMLEKC